MRTFFVRHRPHLLLGVLVVLLITVLLLLLEPPSPRLRVPPVNTDSLERVRTAFEAERTALQELDHHLDARLQDLDARRAALESLEVQHQNTLHQLQQTYEKTSRAIDTMGEPELRRAFAKFSD